MRYKALNLLRPTVGLLLCAALAVLLANYSRAYTWRVSVPLAFSAIVFALGWRYGRMVGIVGSVLAAGVFAYFLFPPLYSFRVESEAARSNLAWMLLAGLVLSYLLLPGSKISGKKK